MGVELKYAIKNSKGEYAGAGSKISYELKDGEEGTCEIKSITSCHMVNTADGRRISVLNMKDFSLP